MLRLTKRISHWLRAATTVSLLAAAPAIAQVAQPSQSVPVAPSSQVVRNAAWWTDASRILAGQMPEAGSALGKIANIAPVQQHRDAFARSWSAFETARLKPAMQFAHAEITSQPQTAGALFYPFSGPDALYALALFPNAPLYVLLGLEPVGDLPDLNTLSEGDLATSFAELRASIASILAFSFFRTREM